jgi:hypothetical protein
MLDLPLWLALVHHLSATPWTYLAFRHLPTPVLAGQCLEHFGHHRSPPGGNLGGDFIKGCFGMLLPPRPQLLIHLLETLPQLGFLFITLAHRSYPPPYFWLDASILALFPLS